MGNYRAVAGLEVDSGGRGVELIQPEIVVPLESKPEPLIGALGLQGYLGHENYLLSGPYSRPKPKAL